jgi:hypothetical protein
LIGVGLSFALRTDMHSPQGIHGADDQIVPIAASAEKAAKIVTGAQLKVYSGASQGSRADRQLRPQPVTLPRASTLECGEAVLIAMVDG